MLIKRISSLSLPIFFSFVTYAQNSAVAKPYPHLTILSEVHTMGNAPSKNLLIKKLYEDNDLKNIVFEIGKAHAYMVNQYIETGDTNIMHMLSPNPLKRSASGTATSLRQMYINGDRIAVHGIDFERPLFFTAAIKYICQKKKMTDNELYKYVAGIADTTISRISSNDALWKERGQLLADCNKLYNANAKYYDAVEDGSFSIKDIFTNPVSESNFDAAMVQNLLPIINGNKGSLLQIIGSYHIDNNGKLYRKLLRESSLTKEDVIVISMLCKNCESGGLYNKVKKHDFAGNDAFVKDTAIAQKIFDKYAQQGALSLVTADDNFYNLLGIPKADGIDQVLLVDCSE